MDIVKDFETYDPYEKENLLNRQLAHNLNGIEINDGSCYLTDNNTIVRIEADFDQMAGYDLSTSFGELFFWETDYLENQSKYDKFDDILSHYKVEQSGSDIPAMYKDIQALSDAAEKRGDILLPITEQQHHSFTPHLFVGMPCHYLDQYVARWECKMIGVALADKKEIKAEFGKDPEAREKAIDLLKSEVDEIDTDMAFAGQEYQYTEYNMKGEELNTTYQSFASIIRNGVETDLGCNLTEKLGEYDSIEECLEANKERLGITIEPVKPLAEHLHLAEGKVDKENEGLRQQKETVEPER